MRARAASWATRAPHRSIGGAVAVATAGLCRAQPVAGAPPAAQTGATKTHKHTQATGMTQLVGQCEWPVYSLADYDNAGRLLDECRALLATTNGPAHDAKTTSGYQTTTTTTTATTQASATESPASGARPADRVPGRARGAQVHLRWWQLIENEDEQGARGQALGEQQLANVDLYRVQVLQLLHSLQAAVR